MLQRWVKLVVNDSTFSHNFGKTDFRNSVIDSQGIIIYVSVT